MWLRRNEPVMELAAEMIALCRWMDVQLGELEGIAEPLVAVGGCEWRGDLLAPPQARLAGVSVGKADEPSAQVESAKREKARVPRVASQGISKAHHPPMSAREAERARKDPQHLVNKTPAELCGAQRAY